MGWMKQPSMPTHPTIEGPLELLREIIHGRPVSREQLQSTSWLAPCDLDRVINIAWIEMQQWLSDEDIRSRDPEYARMRLDRLKWLLAEIERLAASS